MRLSRPIIVLAALVGVAALSAPSAVGADAPQPTITVSIADAPDPVTAGEQVRYLTTLTNEGPATITHVELAFPLPAGMTVDSATPTTGTCTQASAEVDCQIGKLAAGDSVQVGVIANAPSQTGSVSVTAQWTADIGQDDPHQYFATATTSVVARSQDLIADYAPPAGETLTTDPGTGATTSNPQVTTARIPASAEGTPATLAESNASGPADGCAPSATCFGQISTITIGQTFSPGNPLRFTFGLDATEIPAHTKVSKIPMYHDGVLVPSCTGSAGQASPDPCVASRTQNKKTKDVAIVVLSSINGRWRP
jgi:uncharacterized repeat protein (TIGR01451 family)